MYISVRIAASVAGKPNPIPTPRAILSLSSKPPPVAEVVLEAAEIEVVEVVKDGDIVDEGSDEVVEATGTSMDVVGKVVRLVLVLEVAIATVGNVWPSE